MRKIIVVVLAGGVVGVASWFVARPHFRVGVLNTLGMQTNAPVEPDLAPARFMGRQACAACHQQEDHLWQGSHHDLAMQEANEQTVLGDFNHAQVTQFGVTSTFYRQDGRYLVRTDGPDGALQDYEITFTFGVTPLQQYLIEFPGRRLQALGIAWDSRPAQEGGQRWFHLYPDEPIRHNDILHWTGLNQNWNFMCAECHSTDLQKHYDLATNGYHTTWFEPDACHGPGSRHVEWAQRRAERKSSEPSGDSGLLVALKDRHQVQWHLDATTGNARRSPSRSTDHEIQVCGRCHSRRSVIAPEYVYGKHLLDTHLPALLDAGLYHVDGQIEGEAYEYSSFLQSKMYQQGVTCSDCHEPHSLQLRAPGEAVCAQCHRIEKYAARAHHFHPPESAGASCVACHMPPTTYMVIDPRHDHSLRIPRPDLSVAVGTPNACNQCHVNQTAEWASAQVRQWYGRNPTGYQRYAEALQAGRTGQPGAEARLTQLAGDATQPAMARATALSLLHSYLNPASMDVVRDGLQDPEPIVRRAALQALEGLSPQARWPLAGPALADPIRAVRLEAARLLAPLLPTAMTAEQRRLFDAAVQEYIAAQQANADRAEPHLNLGWLHTQRRRLADDLSYVAFGTHALSNYLTVVAATVEFLLLSLADHSDPQVRAWLEGLQHATNLMIHTVSQMMTASPTTDSKLQFVQVNFPLLVRRASTYYQRVAERKRMHISFTSTADELSVRTDPVAVAAVLDNLLSNAVKYSAPRPAHLGARRQRGGRRGLPRA